MLVELMQMTQRRVADFWPGHFPAKGKQDRMTPSTSMVAFLLCSGGGWAGKSSVTVVFLWLLLRATFERVPSKDTHTHIGIGNPERFYGFESYKHISPREKHAPYQQKGWLMNELLVNIRCLKGKKGIICSPLQVERCQWVAPKLMSNELLAPILRRIRGSRDSPN